MKVFFTKRPPPDKPRRKALVEGSSPSTVKLREVSLTALMPRLVTRVTGRYLLCNDYKSRDILG